MHHAPTTHLVMAISLSPRLLPACIEKTSHLHITCSFRPPTPHANIFILSTPYRTSYTIHQCTSLRQPHLFIMPKSHSYSIPTTPLPHKLPHFLQPTYNPHPIPNNPPHPVLTSLAKAPPRARQRTLSPRDSPDFSPASHTSPASSLPGTKGGSAEGRRRGEASGRVCGREAVGLWYVYG